MKRIVLPVLVAVSACSSPAPKREVLVRPVAAEPSAFDVSDVSGDSETRRYRIKTEDLLIEGADSTLNVYSEGTFAGPSQPPSPDLTTAILGQTVGLIREFIAPRTWNDPRRAAYVEKDEIVVRHVPAVLAKVERLFETLKPNREAMVTLRARFVSVPKEELASIEHLPQITGALGGLVDGTELLAGPRARVKTAPNLTVFHGQFGCIRIASNFAYIGGYERNEAGYQPKPGIIQAGIELKVRAIRNGAGSNRWLAALSIVERDVPGHPPLPFVILGNRLYEMPVSIESRAEGIFAAGPGETIVILLGPVTPNPEHFHLVLLELHNPS